MNRNRVKVRIKGPYVKSLSVEQLQRVILWIYGLVPSGKTRSPSFFSIHNRESLRSTNLVFVANEENKLDSYNCRSLVSSLHADPEKHVFRLKEFVLLEDAIKMILADIDRSRIDHSNTTLTRENVQKFLVRDLGLIFSRYNQRIPSSMSLLGVDCSTFVSLTGESKYWLVSIDCEMVETKTGREIGRVSVVDHHNNIVYDRYVRPKNSVVNFLTECSGLDESSLASGISSERMQSDLQKIIGRDTIILGHSLESDLVALQIYHDKIIDTSHLFLSKDNKKLRLKELALRYLNSEIQEKKHCSVEDALQCLGLLKYKVEEFSLLEKSRKTLSLNATINHLKVGSVEEAGPGFLEVKCMDDLPRFFGCRNLNMILASRESLQRILEMQRLDPRSIFLYFYEYEKKTHVVI